MHADISMVKRLQSVAVENLRQRRFACNKILPPGDAGESRAVRGDTNEGQLGRYLKLSWKFTWIVFKRCCSMISSEVWLTSLPLASAWPSVSSGHVMSESNPRMEPTATLLGI